MPEELKTPWDTPDLPQITIIGNLPFNISTPLLIKYLKLMHQRKNVFSYGRVPCTFTFQDEVNAHLLPPSASETEYAVLKLLFRLRTG